MTTTPYAYGEGYRERSPGRRDGPLGRVDSGGVERRVTG
jgi:hypothetical protein